MDENLIHSKLDKITDQLVTVNTHSGIHSEQIKNINEKMGRGQNAFDDIRSKLTLINDSTAKEEVCLERFENVDDAQKKDRKLLYVVLFLILGGAGTGAAVTGPQLLSMVKSLFGVVP